MLTISKRLKVSGLEELREFESKVVESMAITKSSLSSNLKELEPLELFYKMKFEASGTDPLDLGREINLIEQINQAFTYIASFKAIEKLYELHADREYFLNLGTSPGSDIESLSGNIAAEVFSAVSPKSNQKLKKDIDKVLKVAAERKYVFFLCPGYAPGRVEVLEKNEVQVYSLAYE